MGKVDQVQVLTHDVCHCKGVGKRQLFLIKKKADQASLVV